MTIIISVHCCKCVICLLFDYCCRLDIKCIIFQLELDRFSQAATTQGKISSFSVCNLPTMVSLVKGETDLDKTDKWQIKKIRNKGGSQDSTTLLPWGPWATCIHA